jgi:hypothetical protein
MVDTDRFLELVRRKLRHGAAFGFSRLPAHTGQRCADTRRPLLLVAHTSGFAVDKIVLPQLNFKPMSYERFCRLCRMAFRGVWSGRWESNSQGRGFRAFKTSSLARMLSPSVIGV